MSELDYTHLTNTASTTSGNWATDIANAASNFACNLYSGNRDWFVQQSGPLSAPAGFIDGLMSNACAGRPGYTAPDTSGSTPAPAQGDADPNYAYCAGHWDWQSHYEGETQIFYNSAPGRGIDKPYTSDGRSQIMGASGTVYYTEPNASKPNAVLLNFHYTPADPACNMPAPAPVANPPTSAQLSATVIVGGVPTKASFKGVNKDGSVNIDVGNVPVKLAYTGADVGAPTASLAIATNTDSSPSTYTEQPATASSDGQSGKDSNVAGLKYVVIDITSVPVNANIRLGHGEPDIIYAGWIEFQRGGYSFPKEYISFAKALFIAPDGADGYAYTLDVGYIGTASAIVATPTA